MSKAHQRMWDLIRHQRSELLQAELITEDEYAELAKDHAAVKRLEDYDGAVRLAEAKARLDTLKQCAVEAGERTAMEGISSGTMLGEMWDTRIADLRRVVKELEGK